MGRLYELSKLSNNEFLSFLYAERDRQESKSGAPGWSMWALAGSAFALVFFVYNTLKDVEAIDYLLCYYIFSVFCPIVLYIIFMMEQIRVLNFGDSRHVERIKHVAPIPLLVCLSGVYGSLIVLGIFIGASIESVIRCGVVLVPIIVSLITIAIERNNLVTTQLSFRVSAHKWWNRILMGLIGGAMLCPLYGGIKHLAFGFSQEFEVTFAIVLLVAILYMFIQNKVCGNRVADIDGLIDCFLYHDWKKERIVRELELMKLGRAPFMELEMEYNKVVEVSGSIAEKKNRATELAKEIEEQGLREEDLDGLFEEVEDITRVMKEVLNRQKAFSEKARELLDLKTTLNDSEFRAMLDTAYNIPFADQVFGDCHKVMNIVDGKIVPAINSFNKNIEQMVCCRDCPNRICNETNEDNQ